MKHFILSVLLTVICTIASSQDLIKVNDNVFEVEIISHTKKEVSFYDLTTPDKTFHKVSFKEIKNIYYEEWAEGHFSWRLKVNFTPYGSRHIMREYLNEMKSNFSETNVPTTNVPTTGDPGSCLFRICERIKFRVPIRLGINFDYCFTKNLGLGNLFEYTRTSNVHEAINYENEFWIGVTTFSYTPHIFLSIKWHDFHLLFGPAFSSHTFATYGTLKSNDLSMGLFTGIEIEGSKDRKSSVRFHVHCRFNEMVTIGPMNEILKAGKYKNANVVIGLSFGGKFLEPKKI